MQSKGTSFPVDSKKKTIIAILFTVAGAICVSGMFFSIYSYVNNISFLVINTRVPGLIVGVAVLYLGVRYFISLIKLKNELYKPTSRFSWNNFKKNKKAKNS